MKRNYGIDLLRMAAMVLVILLHLTGVGGICAGAPWAVRSSIFLNFSASPHSVR